MKIKNIILVCSVSCGLSATLSSCSDMLDTVPQGQFTAEQLDDSSIEGLVASAYAGLEAHFFGNNEALLSASPLPLGKAKKHRTEKKGGALLFQQSKKRGDAALRQKKKKGGS